MRERLGVSLHSEEERRLREYTGRDIDRTIAKGHMQTDQIDQIRDRKAHETIGRNEPNREVRTTGEQFEAMANNTKFRLKSGRIDA